MAHFIGYEDPTKRKYDPTRDLSEVKQKAEALSMQKEWKVFHAVAIFNKVKRNEFETALVDAFAKFITTKDESEMKQVLNEIVTIRRNDQLKNIWGAGKDNDGLLIPSPASGEGLALICDIHTLIRNIMINDATKIRDAQMLLREQEKLLEKAKKIKPPMDDVEGEDDCAQMPSTSSRGEQIASKSQNVKKVVTDTGRTDTAATKVLTGPGGTATSNEAKQTQPPPTIVNIHNQMPAHMPPPPPPQTTNDETTKMEKLVERMEALLQTAEKSADEKTTHNTLMTNVQKLVDALGQKEAENKTLRAKIIEIHQNHQKTLNEIKAAIDTVKERAAQKVEHLTEEKGRLTHELEGERKAARIAQNEVRKLTRKRRLDQMRLGPAARRPRLEPAVEEQEEQNDDVQNEAPAQLAEQNAVVAVNEVEEQAAEGVNNNQPPPQVAAVVAQPAAPIIVQQLPPPPNNPFEIVPPLIVAAPDQQQPHDNLIAFNDRQPPNRAYLHSRWIAVRLAAYSNNLPAAFHAHHHHLPNNDGVSTAHEADLGANDVPNTTRQLFTCTINNCNRQFVSAASRASHVRNPHSIHPSHCEYCLADLGTADRTHIIWTTHKRQPGLCAGRLVGYQQKKPLFAGDPRPPAPPAANLNDDDEDEAPAPRPQRRRRRVHRYGEEQ